MAKNRKRRKKKNGLFAVLVIFLLLLFIAAGITFAAFASTNGNTIHQNIFVDNVDLSNLTREDALYKLELMGWTAKTKKILTVNVCDMATVQADPVKAGILLDSESAVDYALAYGKDDNMYVNLYNRIRRMFNPVDMNEMYKKFNPDHINDVVAEATEKYNDAFGTEGYAVDYEKGEITLTKGQGTTFIDTSELYNDIVNALYSQETELDFNKISGSFEAPDFETIFNAECVEMRDACFASDGSYTVLEEQTGCTFDIEEAKVLWDNASLGETVHLPLVVTEPTVTKEYLESMMFRDLLGACTTKYNNSGANRCNNVRLAASKLNDFILYPGEEFSFNEVVGRRTYEAGFLPAAAYADMSVVSDEVGGGVCQVSTTLYAATLFAFLEVTDHTCHIYPPNYIQCGMDTTVTIPENGGNVVDYKFVNNKNWPIKLVAYNWEGWDERGAVLKQVTVEIWGTLEEDDYMPIEFDNSYAGVYDYDRRIEPAYDDRPGYIIKFTHDEVGFTEDEYSGFRTLTYRTIYDEDWNFVDQQIINREYPGWYAMDTYYFRNYD